MAAEVEVLFSYQKRRNVVRLQFPRAASWWHTNPAKRRERDERIAELERACQTVHQHPALSLAEVIIANVDGKASGVA
jgi:hypothetical protein